MWCHPLCDSRIVGEATDPLSTLKKVEGVKAASHAHVLDAARSAPAVTSGLRVIVYTTRSYTSLGALGKGTVKCLNAAAGYLKKRAVAAARSPRRDSRVVSVPLSLRAAGCAHARQRTYCR